MTAIAGPAGWSRIRAGLQTIFDDSDERNWRATLVRRIIILIVLVSIASIVLETVPDLAAREGGWFRFIEGTAIVIFTAEFVLRLWSAPDDAMHGGEDPWRARLDFVRSAPAMVDLISVVPTYVGWVTGVNFKIFVLLRLVRFFKLARYSPGMRSLAMVLQAERRALLASAVILLGFVLLSASAMYSVEHDAQPDKFGSIPASMWWAIVTLTTVGYGDVYPVTLLGRLVASVTMVFGLMTLALPVGIVATAFAEEIHRREFVVTWGMIARVPLFNTLSAAEIGDITRFLNARTVTAGAVIVRRGDTAHSMFVIATGAVEVELPNGPVTLGEGQFFGEMALLEKSVRSATVRATETTKLLVLDSADLHTMMDRNPAIAERITAIARARQDETAKQD